MYCQHVKVTNVGAFLARSTGNQFIMSLRGVYLCRVTISLMEFCYLFLLPSVDTVHDAKSYLETKRGSIHFRSQPVHPYGIERLIIQRLITQRLINRCHFEFTRLMVTSSSI
jgi:hypothetical protein